MPPVNSKPEQPLAPAVLEDQHEDRRRPPPTESRLSSDRLRRDHDGAERDEHQPEREQQHEAEHERRDRLHLVAEVAAVGGHAGDGRPRSSGTAPIVAGMMSSRSASRAAFEVESVPSPSVGIAMLATVFAALVSTSIGSFMTPGRERTPFQLVDRVPYGRRLDVRRLDDDAGGVPRRRGRPP